MTLLELLVKELPKRGGWPIPAETCQSYKNDTKAAYFFDSGLFQVPVPYIISLVDIDELNSAFPVTREQYEAAIAAQQSVWDGEGLPPVGCKCEYVGNDTSWGIVKVIGYDEDRVVFKPSGEDYYGITPGDKALFRPIRTESDRKRGEAIDALISLGVFTRPVAEKTVDAIAAGKIPGVEISK